MANSYGTFTALSGNANSLANGGFASLGVIDFGSAPPHLCWLEIKAQASAATSAGKRLVVYARAALDGTNYSDAGSSANELNLTRIGFVSLTDTSAHVSRPLEVAGAFGGGLPTKVDIVVKNDCGVSLSASGNTGSYRTETLG
jgi:hypothetical protein